MGLPTALAFPRDRYLLLLKMAVGKAEVDLTRSVPAKLPTQCALRNDVVAGEFLTPCRDAPRAFLGRHHVGGWLHRSLLAVVR